MRARTGFLGPQLTLQADGCAQHTGKSYAYDEFGSSKHKRMTIFCKHTHFSPNISCPVPLFAFL